MNILVNGGTRGIGKEVTSQLASDKNNNLIVTGRNKKVLDELEAIFPNIRGIPADLSVFDNQSESFIRNVGKYFSKLDILINLAGLMISKDFAAFKNDEARLIMETNFFGPATLIRLVVPLMPSGSHIVNVSSMGGFQGSSKFKGLSYYSASKAALACLSECLANEFREYGISVNCLALGSVQTEMLDAAFPGYKAPLEAKQMAEFISAFALTGHKYFNGKILPVAVSNP